MIEQIVYALPFLLGGFQTTLIVSVLVVVISLVGGVLLGVALIYGPLAVRLLIRVFSDTIRGIPILVLLFFVYYGLPAAGMPLDAFTSAVVALTLFKIAQVIEYVRGAVQSVPKGQDEAAKAIGLTFTGRLREVIFPQAFRRFLPPWINGVADAVKGSALVSLLGVIDLMYAINQVIGRTYDAMPLYVLGAFIYISINYALSATSRHVERRFSYIRE
jgi:polar amino acid transport system permease protein